MTEKIIIDTDPGIDDAMAIHLAFAHPGLEVVALTTIFGNVHTATATRNALVLAEMAQYPCAVAQGADKPLVLPLNPPADFVHGAEGFGDLPARTPTGKPDPRSAAAYICEMAAAHPGEITLCAVGPLTNLALALRHDPAVTKNLKRVVIMGGAVDAPGNVSPFAEANIINDPHAAEEVFAADWPITLVGLDVTMQVRCTPDDFASMPGSSPTIGGFLNDATQFYFDFHRRQHDLNCCFMHDPTAVIAVTDPDVLTCESVPLSVICEGEKIGQTVRIDDPARRPVDVALGVDIDRVRSIFIDTIKSADGRVAERTAK
ncbi:nucleoside hydrolase [Rhodospirillaceae bacterium KN72]|uniref:Nucleoside hydrolase n=1 Tax=Pacificispira spongiicola TaxID=2729598 RepID=A0A7Y0HD49_9PROT|nr:nucleoside hydrolase [Pacificispira spongiicola]NMM43265.1 nucleoside hydrolase [Pacificispira spongiicola]